jgi:hypothetical protein
MPRYYFDSRDNNSFIKDEDGVELASFNDAKKEAARALGGIARDVLPGAVVRILTIEVRDDLGPVLKATLRFEIEHVREDA